MNQKIEGEGAFSRKRIVKRIKTVLESPASSKE